MRNSWKLAFYTVAPLVVITLGQACSTRGGADTHAHAPECRAPTPQVVAAVLAGPLPAEAHGEREMQPADVPDATMGLTTAPTSARAEIAPERPMVPGIRWVVADEEDRPDLDPWCAVVGPPVVKTEGQRTDAAIDSLVVVSWNVHVGGGDVIRFVEDLRAGHLTGAPVEHFVLLVQEAHRRGADVPPVVRPGRVPRGIESHPTTGERLDIVEAARRLRLNLFYAPSMRNGTGRGSEAEDRGNAILSSLPLREPQAIELPYEAQRRVSVAARLGGATARGSAWELKVASVHFDTRSRLSRLLQSVGPARLRQAQGFVEGLSLAGSTVVGGDLNTWSAGALEQAIPFLMEHFPETPVQAKPTFTVGEIIARRLDYLFFRLPASHQARVRRVDSRYGSDHYPILGWVRFP